MRHAVPDRNGKTLHKVQAAAEGVAADGTVTFRGRSFRLGACESIAPMLDFAEAAQAGVDTEDPAGLAAMKDMLRDCFILSLFEVVKDATEQAMARPTRAPSGSSSPAPARSGNSKARSSSPGMPAAFTKAFEAGDVVDVADALQ